MTSEDPETSSQFINSFAEWQPDGDIFNCLNCNARFSFVNRKHHCRCCGCIFCASCSDNFVRYDTTKVNIIKRWQDEVQYAPYRTCVSCYSNLLVNKMLLSASGKVLKTKRMQTLESQDTGNTKYTESELTECSNEAQNINDNHVSSNQMENNKLAPMDSNNTIDVTDSDNNAESPNRIADNEVTNDVSIETNEDNHCPICYFDLSSLKNETESAAHVDMCIKNASKIQQHKGANFDDQDQLLKSPTTYKNRMLVLNVQENNDEHPSSAEYKECPICFEDMEPGDKIGRLECLCAFHYTCIKAWIKKKTQKLKESKSQLSVRQNFCPLHDAIL